MPLPAQSPEFARLATRWLDGTATAVEARQLWESVQSDVACAKEFADQARFELLLQDTLRERLREQGIAAGARQQTVKYQRRATMRRVLAVAAVILAAGFLLWLVLPSPHTAASSEITLAPPPTAPSHPLPAHRTAVLMAREEPSTAKPDDAAEPLNKRLDQFFLTSIDLDKVPLNVALKQLEDQLRELNFANKADLAALHVLLPSGAGSQAVTFHSGSISFLKAVRALAALAGYDVDAGDTAVSLIARADGNPLRVESRTVDHLLTQLGGTADPTRSRLTELLNDARSLGLKIDSAKDGSGDASTLRATPGEFEALMLLSQSRDQIRSMPPIRFFMKAGRSPPGAQDRVLIGPEAEKERADFDLFAESNLPTRITVPLLESLPSDQIPQGKIMVGATPVGSDTVYLSVFPGTGEDSSPASLPIVAVVNSNPLESPEVIHMQFTIPSSLITGNIQRDLAVLTPKTSQVSSGTTGSLTLGNNSGTLNMNGGSLTDAASFAINGEGQGSNTAVRGNGLEGTITSSANGYMTQIVTLNGTFTVNPSSLTGSSSSIQLSLYRDTSTPPP